ncbi:flagellin [Alkalilimnicola ehrlichii]|uniref:flagellin n=1 Tax=Alkalilimnicola ehrlichii TaxID=351052 RepID=UPI003BA09B67
MAQVINTNIASLNAQRNLNASQGQLGVALERLSSGLRINSAKDDAAGLAISSRFTSQINGLDQAVRNANDGISFAQTAEGALDESTNLLQRIRELAVQASNDTNSASDRDALDQEVQQAIREISRIAASTQFNNQNILDGSLSDLIFQVGANRGQIISVDGVDARAQSLGAQVADSGAVATNTLSEGGELSIAGVTIDMDGAENISDVISRINDNFSETGVQAFQTSGGSIVAETGLSEDEISFTADPDPVQLMTINGVNVFSEAGAGIDNPQELAERINAYTPLTGVSAVDVDGELVLESQADQESIRVTDVNADLFEATTTDFGEETVFFDENDDLRTELTFERGFDLRVPLEADPPVIADDSDGDLLQRLGLVGGADRFETFSADTVSVATRGEAQDAIRTVDIALQEINGIRADLGAVQNRFEATTANLTITSENLSASRSRIMDADFAAETAALTRGQILQQAGTSVLAQANQLPNNVLNLLQ